MKRLPPGRVPGSPFQPRKPLPFSPSKRLRTNVPPARVTVRHADLHHSSVMRLRPSNLFCALTLTACASLDAGGGLSVSSSQWGTMPDGRPVELFVLKNAAGMEVRITNYGGIITHLFAPDKDGQLADVVLGFDSLAPYLGKHPHFGCLTGRYANRIGGASFEIDGVRHNITANSGKNHIHGGKDSFARKLWSAQAVRNAGSVGVRMTYTSPDGEEGFPGQLNCVATYSLNDKNELSITYRATTDKPTVVNLTNHSYFNLAGEGNGSILGHELTFRASEFTPTDDALIPTGEIASVLGTPLDFTRPERIGDRIDDPFKPLQQGKGYDHNFVIPGSGLRSAARVREPKSGRVMTVSTTTPGVQFYTGNHLSGVKGKKGHTYGKRSGFCLETQHYPDSPNQPLFPSVVLRPGDEYQQTTVFTFSTES